MCTGIAKTVLGAINMVFLLISLAFMAAGVILAFLPDVIMDTVFNTVKDQISGLTANQQFQIPDSASDLTEIPLAHEIGIALFALGLALFIISFLGCCGACCSCCKIMLILFAVVMAVLVIVEVTFFGLFLTKDSPLHDEIKTKLGGKISDPYDETSPTLYDMTLNIINYNFDCCGMAGRTDYNMAPGVTIGGQAVTDPLSCDSHTNGCYDKLQDLIQDNIIYAGLVAGCLCGLQVIEIIFAIIVFKDSGKVSPL